jgi:hypothetical protein
VKHVWVIALANQTADAAFGPSSPAPYLSQQLRAQGLLLPNFSTISGGELPNLVALVSGQGPNPETAADCATYDDVTPGTIGSDGEVAGHGCVYPAKAKTLPDQLTGAGLTWRAYLEDIGNGSSPAPTSCRHPDAGQADPFASPRPGDAYLTRRDPFVYFHSIADSPDCASQVVGLDQLAGDLKTPEQTPAFSYIAPNACHDGRDDPCADGAPAGLAAADTWLQSVVPQIVQSKAYADGGLVVITFDQAPPAPGAQPGPGKVGALLLSKFVKAGGTVDTAYDPYALLRSIEDLFGLDPIGHAADAGVKGFGRNVYSNLQSQDVHKHATGS